MKLKTILFDIGGVLTLDPYETIILHEEYGLGRELNITSEELSKKISAIWAKYATLASTKESDFWSEVNKTLGTQLKSEDIEAVKHKVITPNPEAIDTFNLIKEKGIRLGIISNNTSFFYELQAGMLPFDKYMEPELIFLSHEKGCRKSDGLFEVAVETVEPVTTFVIDDRQSNVEYARKLGFGSRVYTLEHGDSLKELVQGIITEYS